MRRKFPEAIWVLVRDDKGLNRPGQDVLRWPLRQSHLRGPHPPNGPSDSGSAPLLFAKEREYRTRLSFSTAEPNFVRSTRKSRCPELLDTKMLPSSVPDPVVPN